MRTSRLFIGLAAFVVICVLVITTAQIRAIELFAATTNSPPVAAADTFTGLAARHQDAPGLLANDSDPDGNPLSVKINPVVSPQYGYLTLYGNGSFNYTPNSSYPGTDTFTYKVCDNQTACSTATVTLNEANHAPTAAADIFTGLGARHQSAPGVLANDTDSDNDAFTVKTVLTVAPLHGYVTIYGSGEFYYTPTGGYVGSDSFTYKVCDSLGLCSYGTVTLNEANHAPTVGDDAYAGLSAGHQSAPGVLLNDSDSDNDTFTVKTVLTVAPLHGYVTIYGSGEFYYTPSGGYVGSDSFTYKVCDSLNACSYGKVTLFVIGDGENDGAASCNARRGEPINVTNGNMYLQQGDYCPALVRKLASRGLTTATPSASACSAKVGQMNTTNRLRLTTAISRALTGRTVELSTWAVRLAHRAPLRLSQETSMGRSFKTEVMASP